LKKQLFALEIVAVVDDESEEQLIDRFGADLVFLELAALIAVFLPSQFQHLAALSQQMGHDMSIVADEVSQLHCRTSFVGETDA
jgi:hypothetical protein